MLRMSFYATSGNAVSIKSNIECLRKKFILDWSVTQTNISVCPVTSQVIIRKVM